MDKQKIQKIMSRLDRSKIQLTAQEKREAPKEDRSDLILQVVSNSAPLSLSGGELRILLHLLIQPDDAHSSRKIIADRLGVALSTVERQLKSLKDKGLIEIGKITDESGIARNVYSFEPLVDRLGQLSK